MINELVPTYIMLSSLFNIVKEDAEKFKIEMAVAGFDKSEIEVTVADGMLSIKSVKENKEVIVSSGTIGSPHILQASGIGPGELLKKNNVNVVKDHPGVGMNLTDHLMLRPVYKVKNLESLNDIYYSMTKKFMTGLKYLLFRKGPLTVGASYLCGLDRKSVV